MTDCADRKTFFILGRTRQGKPFRPSDWAERLAGVMAQFHPAAKGFNQHLGYSPWCVPGDLEGLKCVKVNPALREFEPLAWDFCIGFARDNDLLTKEELIYEESLLAEA